MISHTNLLHFGQMAHYVIMHTPDLKIFIV
nr:MAG TPA: hypothetical protein [Caudoviricetes sp.]